MMKYAFTGRKNGIITATASIRDDILLFIIEDNGIGIPESVGFDNSTGFGFMLVSMLVKQISGTIRIERNSGTRFVMEFTRERAERTETAKKAAPYMPVSCEEYSLNGSALFAQDD